MSRFQSAPLRGQLFFRGADDDRVIAGGEERRSIVVVCAIQLVNKLASFHLKKHGSEKAHRPALEWTRTICSGCTILALRKATRHLNIQMRTSFFFFTEKRCVFERFFLSGSLRVTPSSHFTGKHPKFYWPHKKSSATRPKLLVARPTLLVAPKVIGHTPIMIGHTHQN